VAKMAMTPGFPRVLWMLAVLAVAPFIEELLFRGVLYGGYRRSFGPAGAAVLSTFIFWLLHITESIHFLPAMLAIAVLALLALWFRLRSAAIGPAIAVHLGYNAMLALLVILSAVASPRQKSGNARAEMTILSTKPHLPGYPVSDGGHRGQSCIFGIFSCPAFGSRPSGFFRISTFGFRTSTVLAKKSEDCSRRSRLSSVDAQAALPKMPVHSTKLLWP
jgi:hypothetical protein